MPITGKEDVLSSAIKGFVSSKLEAATGQSMKKDAYMKAFCEGLAEALIPFLTANVQVEAGQVVPATFISTAPGTPVGGVGATSTTTVIT